MVYLRRSARLCIQVENSIKILIFFYIMYCDPTFFSIFFITPYENVQTHLLDHFNAYASYS